MELNRRDFVGGTALAAASGWATPLLAQAPLIEASVDMVTPTGALLHVWEECAGSDRAAITLRESWRHDLDLWRTEAGLKRVRFHGIFADELGGYAPSILNRGKVKPNFQNIFRVYDGLVERGVSPVVEVGFMPKQLASGTRTFGFYSANVTPPKDMAAWSDFITQFGRGLVDRYGVETVRSWPFEIWNEPNLPFFWSGTQQDYFDLYKATAVALKGVDAGLKVGGPATSGGAWVSEFLGYCAQNNAPVDFVATHAYAGSMEKPAAGAAPVSPNDVIPRTVAQTRAAIEASRFAGLPLWLTEWSSDSPAMIAHVITQCLPHVQAMSHWTMSGAYEELGVADYVLKEGDSGWNTLIDGIAKPSFNSYRLLHRLGDTRLAAQGPVLASRRRDGSTALIAWNLAEAEQAAGIPGATSERKVSGTAKRLQIQMAGARPGSRVKVCIIDQERGSPMPTWRRMGSPQYPTPTQMAQLRQASQLPAPVTMRLDAKGVLGLDLQPEAVALVELG